MTISDADAITDEITRTLRAAKSEKTKMKIISNYGMRGYALSYHHNAGRK